MNRPSNHYPGMLASMALYDIRSAIPEAVASNELWCGTFAHIETNENTGLNMVYTATADKNNIIGVVLYNPNMIYDGKLGDLKDAFKYKLSEPATILAQGDIMMVCEVPVNAGDRVYYRITADGALATRFKVSNVEGTGLIKVDGARFVESTRVPGMVAVHIDNPSYTAAV